MNDIRNESEIVIERGEIDVSGSKNSLLTSVIKLSFSLETLNGKDYLVPTGKLRLGSVTEPDKVYDLVLQGPEPQGFTSVDRVRSHLLIWHSKVSSLRSLSFEISLEKIFTRYLSSFEIIESKTFLLPDETSVIITFDSGKGDYHRWMFEGRDLGSLADDQMNSHTGDPLVFL